MPTKKKQGTDIDLTKSIYLRVDGEEEKHHILDWAILRNIGDSLQKLIDAVARNTEDEKVLGLGDVRLKFTGFFDGSAVPAFKLVDNSKTLFSTPESFKLINTSFSSIVKNVESGNFQAIADEYESPGAKNDIVTAVYDFTNCAGTRSLQVVKRTTKGSFTKVAKIRRMDQAVKKLLLVEEPTPLLVDLSGQPVEAVGKFLIKKTKTGRVSRKPVQFYVDKEASLVLKFDSIETDKRLYVLRDHISFDLTEEKKFFMLENKLLDIYAAGKTLNEAKSELYEQFDYTYRRLGSLPDNQLSDHLKNAKKYILFIVEQVKDR